MAITATYPGANGKRLTGMNPYTLSSNRTDHPKSTEKSGVALSKKFYALDHLTCTKCQGKMRIIVFIFTILMVKKIGQPIVKIVLAPTFCYLFRYHPDPFF